MKFGANEKNLLIGLVGVLIAVAAWYLVASPLKEKTAVIQAENVGLKEKKDEYEAVNAQKATYEQGIVDLTAEREDLLSHFPAGISREDEIMYWATLENTYPSDIILNTLAMSNWSEVFVPGAPQSEGEGATQLHLYQAPVTYSFKATYQGVKNMINYVFAQDDKKSIDTLSVAFNSGEGTLDGTMSLNMYYMNGTGKEYIPYNMPSVPTGVVDIFQTAAKSVDSNASGMEVEDGVEVAED